MPLKAHCVPANGSSLIVQPITGWGWQLFDAERKQWISKHLTEFLDPVPFPVAYREPFYVRKELSGGFGVVSQGEHSLCCWHIFFYACFVETTDFDQKDHNGFKIVICREAPIIVPLLNQPFYKWLVNDKIQRYAGFARIRYKEPA